MQESKYAKVKNNSCNAKKVNMDNYRCYLPARVRVFKSSGHYSSPILFILLVHLSVPRMETLMVAPLVMVTRMMSPFPSTPTWSVDLTLAN